MVWVNSSGYLERTVGAGLKYRRKNQPVRDWWLVTATRDNGGRILPIKVFLGPQYEGKKIRFKVEVLEDEQGDTQE